MLNEYFVEWVSRFYDRRFVTFVKNGFPCNYWNSVCCVLLLNGFPGTYWRWISCVLLGMVFQVIIVLGYYVQWLSMYLLAFVLQSSGWNGFQDHDLLTLDFLHIVWNGFPFIMYLFARGLLCGMVSQL